MSNNFDGPIILDSLADAGGPAGAGYLGTGGRVGEDSIGPRLMGGDFANIPPAASVPDASIFLDQTLPGIWLAAGPAWLALTAGSGETIIGAVVDVVAGAYPLAVTVPQALPGDVAIASLQSDDTGGTLGIVTGCIVSGPGQVDVSFANAVTTGDARVSIAVFGTRTA